MSFVSVPRIFKVTWKASVVDLFYSKVTEETSAYYNSFENSFKWIGIFRKACPLEISRNSLLRRVATSKLTGCNNTTNDAQAKFFKEVSKFSENINKISF